MLSAPEKSRLVRLPPGERSRYCSLARAPSQPHQGASWPPALLCRPATHAKQPKVSRVPLCIPNGSSRRQSGPRIGAGAAIAMASGAGDGEGDPGKGRSSAAASCSGAMPVGQRAVPLVSSVAGSLARLLCAQRRNCSAASTSRPVIAAKHPFQVDLKAGKRYAWCACGHSKKQPFCDGSHKKAAPKISSLKFKPEEAKEAWLCGCKYTKNPPYCDGTHKEDFVQKADLLSHPQL